MATIEKVSWVTITHIERERVGLSIKLARFRIRIRIRIQKLSSLTPTDRQTTTGRRSGDQWRSNPARSASFALGTGTQIA